jgi:DNA-binding SARP family transcriptional activator
VGDGSPGGLGSQTTFRVLGELTVLVGGRRTAPPQGNLARLLGTLLLSPGDPVGEKRLLELTWGPDRGSRHALQCAISRLRTWLIEIGNGDGRAARLLRLGQAYQLRIDAEHVDIGRFWSHVRCGRLATDPATRVHHLWSALGEWRGAILGGYATELEEDPVVRLAERTRVESACELADLALRQPRPAQAQVLGALLDVADQAPYDEALHARVVRLLYSCGRRAEAVREAERVRARLAEDLGLDPSQELRTAHAHALKEPETAPRPAELPPDTVDFTGRRAELRGIVDWLTPALPPSLTNATRIAAITGMPGVGKSALAIHAAHRLAPLYADGWLYADLKARTGTPEDPATVLDRFLRALGVRHGHKDTSLAERESTFRTLIATRTILVVLDDAASAEQVRPLLPGVSLSGVLVTSRRYLSGVAGARLIDLDVLAPDEATALLRTVANRKDVTLRLAGEIANACDHLPLAVRIAGVRLSTRPLLRPRELATALRDECRRLDELAVGDLTIRSVLDSSYRCLDEAAQRTLCALGATDAEDITADRYSRPQLEALVDARLLDTLGGGRYRLRDLVRLYAAETAQQHVRAR